MRSGRVRIFNGNQREALQLITQERIGIGPKVFILGGKVDHVTRHVWQLFKGKSLKVKVTRLRQVSADKYAITRQCMVMSTSNLVGII